FNALISFITRFVCGHRLVSIQALNAWSKEPKVELHTSTYSTLHHFGSVASPIGLYFLNVKVTGYYYDKEAKKQMAASGAVLKPGEALNCLGGECFKLSFIIITVVALFGAVISLVLVVRTTKFYQGDIYKKFRNKAEMKEEEDEMLSSVAEIVGVGQEDRPTNLK
ncbi:hypothetical protein TorRG33x02_055620, partial [Trema orientale]